MSELFAPKLEELPNFAPRSNDRLFGLFIFALLMLAAGALLWLCVTRVLASGWAQASAVVDGSSKLFDWQGGAGDRVDPKPRPICRR